MTANDHSTVLVNFEIDRRDLFRASMELAKWRFLIGVVVVLILSILVSWFFFMIDEQTILLETSPLFIGLPLVGLGGQVLRLHAISRKYVAELTPSQRQLQYMFQSSSDGFDISSGGSFSHTVWNDVRSVVEKSRWFLIYLNRFEVRMLPKRGFHPTDIPLFRDLVRLKLGSRAKLSTS